MKIAFFEIEQWEADYVKEKLPGNELFFIENKLNKDNLPQQKDFDAISVFVGSEITKEVIEIAKILASGVLTMKGKKGIILHFTLSF